MQIEKERAKLGQAENARATTAKREGTKREPVPTSSASDSGRARDKAGKKTGVSGKTAEQSAFCVTVMDKLERLGKKTETHMIRQLLNPSRKSYVTYPKHPAKPAKLVRFPFPTRSEQGGLSLDFCMAKGVSVNEQGNGQQPTMGNVRRGVKA